jgi:hypothetical protein
MQPAGIPDGGSLYAKGAVPVNSTVGMSLPTHLVSRGQGPIAIVRAILQSVIFADGHFVGVDGGPGGFDLFGEKIKAFTEVGTLAKTGAWDQVEALVPRRLPGSPPSGEDYIVYTFRQLAATHLVQERKRKGDAAATELANIFSTLPTLWK